MKWEPIIKASISKDIEKKLTEISECLIENLKDLDHPGLMGGKAGILLFFFYYAKYTKDEKYYDIGFELISEIFDQINQGFDYYSFASGLAGIAWLISHLVQNEFIDIDTVDALEDIIPYLYKTMMIDIKKGQYDYLHAAIGNGISFLSHLSMADSKKYLINLIDELDEQSQIDKNGSLKWESVLNRKKRIRGVNLGLSHGIASIIAFLSILLDADIYKKKVLSLLNGAVKFLLQQSQDTKKYKSLFPSWICDAEPSTHSRLAWCYGDLGIGISLWHASQSTGNKEWKEKAIDILLHTTQRKNPKEQAVHDAGLCHGASGLAHIYNRIFHYTGLEVFQKTSCYWIEQTLKMANFEDGFVGYKTWHTEEYGGWLAELGFLEGISGIGLALISVVSNIEPRWDRSLLLS